MSSIQIVLLVSNVDNVKQKTIVSWRLSNDNILSKNLSANSSCIDKSLKSSVRAAKHKYLSHLEVATREKKKTDKNKMKEVLKNEP